MRIEALVGCTVVDCAAGGAQVRMMFVLLLVPLLMLMLYRSCSRRCCRSRTRVAVRAPGNAARRAPAAASSAALASPPKVCVLCGSPLVFFAPLVLRFPSLCTDVDVDDLYAQRPATWYWPAASGATAERAAT